MNKKKKLFSCFALVCLFANTAFGAEVYFGFRNGSNLSPATGVAKYCIAKLHACLQNGYADEASDYGTCTDRCSNGSYNVACTSSGCQAGCDVKFGYASSCI
jgi:hypothetical protein